MSDRLKRPHRRIPRPLARFPVHSAPIGDSRGQSVWLAMPHRLLRLVSRLPSSGYQTLSPSRSACRRSNTRHEQPCWLVLSSVGISFPSKASCPLFRSTVLVSHHLPGSYLSCSPPDRISQWSQLDGF